MKTLSTIHNYYFILLALSFGLTTQAQLLNETFDNTDGFTIADQNGATTFVSDGSNDYFGIYDGDGDGGADFGTKTTNPSGISSYSSTSDNYIAGEDLDGEGNTDPFILTWYTIAGLHSIVRPEGKIRRSVSQLLLRFSAIFTNLLWAIAAFPQI